MVPIRSFLDAVTQGTEVADVIDLDLQFEDNEVFDLFSMKVDMIMFQDTAADAVSELQYGIGLFDDPNKETLTNIFDTTVFETDASLIHHETGIAAVNFTTAAGFVISRLTDSRVWHFPQPWTVARNMKLIAAILGTQADLLNMNFYTTLWGRRRNAPDAEFKNIIYRQRF